MSLSWEDKSLLMGALVLVDYRDFK